MKKAKTKNSSLPTSAASRHTTPLRGYFLSSRFICEATNHSSSRFCYEATGGRGLILERMLKRIDLAHLEPAISMLALFFANLLDMSGSAHRC